MCTAGHRGRVRWWLRLCDPSWAVSPLPLAGTPMASLTGPSPRCGAGVRRRRAPTGCSSGTSVSPAFPAVLPALCHVQGAASSSPAWLRGFPTGPTCFLPRRREPEAWHLEALAADSVRLLLVPSRDKGTAEVGHHVPSLEGARRGRLRGLSACEQWVGAVLLPGGRAAGEAGAALAPHKALMGCRAQLCAGGDTPEPLWAFWRLPGAPLHLTGCLCPQAAGGSHEWAVPEG